MTAIVRRSNRSPVSESAVLCTADDLNGTNDNTQAFNVTGAARALIVQIDNGTAGTTGIDVVQVSHDGGNTWAAATDLLAIDSDDASGSVVANAALNAAGVEPASKVAIWKMGPFEGPVAIRCVRNSSDDANSAAWTTGAPTVKLIAIGLTTGALSALA